MGYGMLGATDDHVSVAKSSMCQSFNRPPSFSPPRTTNFRSKITAACPDLGGGQAPAVFCGVHCTVAA